MSLDAPQIPVEQIVSRRMRPEWMKTLILSLVIFACGGAGGWALALKFHRPPPPPQISPNGGNEPPIDQLVGRLRDELLLTDDQVRQINDIYTQRQAALNSIREEMRPRLEAEYTTLKDQMQKVLTPPQFTRWNQRFEDVRNRMLPPPRGGMNGMGPGPRGGRGGPGFGPGFGGGGPDGGGPGRGGPPRGGPDGGGWMQPGMGGPMGDGGPDRGGPDRGGPDQTQPATHQ